jgi:hypothetical protein
LGCGKAEHHDGEHVIEQDAHLRTARKQRGRRGGDEIKIFPSQPLPHDLMFFSKVLPPKGIPWTGDQSFNA